ncbi:MAG: sarcosine oxidase subunit delta [Tagaea sp.]|nr:sarcosine oxidase subunit delta [Azospirillum sp.]MCA3266269.1 sarcosine oxidase subunit delta [Azospirillum sp.]MCZ8123504.1 sarcosine oxidase subunit delta [Magnetospirillum sp.]
MRLVPCPTCGPREAGEFVCFGEPRPRPDGTRPLAEAIYARDNLKGPVAELWWHRAGCRRWLTLRRNSATNAFVE